MYVRPQPSDIIKVRQAAGLTQEQAARQVVASTRCWQSWELGEAKMHPGLWELFLIKTKIADKVKRFPELYETVHNPEMMYVATAHTSTLAALQAD